MSDARSGLLFEMQLTHMREGVRLLRLTRYQLHLASGAKRKELERSDRDLVVHIRTVVEGWKREAAEARAAAAKLR